MKGLDPLNVELRGTHLVEASAGTGKTYTIATLFVRLVVERRLPVDRILVVTFTEAAAAELRDRIRSRLQSALQTFEGAQGTDPLLASWAASRPAEARAEDCARLRLALRGFDEAPISTIHGFCHRVLQDRAFETGVSFECELVGNQQPLIDEVVRDYWSRTLVDADPLFVGYLASNYVTPAKLMGLANLAAAYPDAPVIPDRCEIGARPEAAAFRRSFTQARELWWQSRDEVMQLLVSHAGLHKAKYPAETIPTWFQGMDAFFRDEDPGTSLGCPQLDKFARRCLEDATNKGFITPKHPLFDACDELLDARAPLMEQYELRRLELERRLMLYVRRELPRRKAASATMGFDDLLHGLERAVSRRGTGKRLAATIRSRYAAALIDEFQDTDPVQYRIFRAIFGDESIPLFLIGDPKQAIYAFRGADVFAYLQAAQHVGARSRHTMDRNWRSDPDLLAALQHLFSVPRPFLLPDIDFIPVQARPGAQPALRCDGQALPAFEILFQRRRGSAASRSRRSSKTPTIPAAWVDRELPAAIATNIASLLRSGATIDTGDGQRAVRAGDIAVLVRKNAQAQQIQAALRRVGVPGVVYGDASVFDSREAGELFRVLSAIAEPTHNSLLRAALTTELLGVTGAELEAMGSDDVAWSQWVQNLRRWHGLWTERGFIQMFRALLSEASIPQRSLRLLDGERRMTNLLHLAELLHTAATQGHLGPAGLLRWFQQARTQDHTRADEVKLRLEHDDQAVQLITIHRSKGLEYPIVYCPYLWSPDELHANEEAYLRFHDPDDGGRLKLDITPKPRNKHARGKHPHVQRARFECEAESLRLLYVALTRARHRVVVVWGGFDRSYRSPLGYLLAADGLPAAAQRLADVSKRLKDKTDDELLAMLQARAHPTWKIAELDEPRDDRLVPPSAAALDLQARTPRTSIDRLWRTTSFTGLASSTSEDVLELDEGRDRDRPLVSVDPAPVGAVGNDVRLAAFPRGATVGNFFHHVLEHLDFTAPVPSQDDLVQAGLRRYGLSTSLAAAARDALTDVLATPLCADGSPRLQDIASSQRLDELGFLLPMRQRESNTALTRQGLAEALATDPTGLPDGYATSVARLGFAPLRGFLKGYIDLVFRHDGKWYVLDYKTNHLGERPEHYAGPALASAMAEHHYILQYHIYVVAVLRMLRQRIPDFSVERDFGGVYYLFLRGMNPRSGCERGVYFDRPPTNRLRALDAVFAGGGR